MLGSSNCSSSYTHGQSPWQDGHCTLCLPVSQHKKNDTCLKSDGTLPMPLWKGFLLGAQLSDLQNAEVCVGTHIPKVVLGVITSTFCLLGMFSTFWGHCTSNGHATTVHPAPCRLLAPLCKVPSLSCASTDHSAAQMALSMWL